MKIINVNINDDLNELIRKIPANNSEETILRLAPGRYHGTIVIDRPNITIEGENPLSTVITGSLSAYEILDDGLKRGTFRTQTVFIDADNVKLKNITVENTAGRGDEAGQAIALYADGQGLEFYNCRFLGSQDTIFAAPLPEKEVEAGGFRGPKEKAERRRNSQYYKDCYIEGDIDFIFGGAAAFFENCDIYSLKREKGYITAASTPSSQEYGFVFYRCRFLSDSEPGSYYLGRPWRENAKTVLIECELGGHISKEGWHDWNDRGRNGGVYYAEYASSGNGAADEKRIDFAHILDEKDAEKYTREKVLMI